LPRRSSSPQVSGLHGFSIHLTIFTPSCFGNRSVQFVYFTVRLYFVCLLDICCDISSLLQFVIPIPTFVVHAVRHSPLHSFHSQFVILTVFVIHLLLMVFVYTKSVFRFYFVRVLYCSSWSHPFIIKPIPFDICTTCKSIMSPFLTSGTDLFRNRNTCLYRQEDLPSLDGAKQAGLVRLPRAIREVCRAGYTPPPPTAWGVLCIFGRSAERGRVLYIYSLGYQGL